MQGTGVGTAVSFVVAGLILAGCTNSDDGVAPPTTAVDRVGGLGYVDSLLYGDGRGRLAQEQRIRDVLVACMNRRGFDYPLAPFASNVREAESPAPVVRVAPFSSYGITTATPVAESDDPLLAYYEGLDRTTQQAFDSAAVDCAAESRGAGFENFERYEELRNQLQELRIELVGQIDSDQTVRLADRDWAACMELRGYQFDRPQLAVDDVALVAAEKPADAAAHESAVASADSDCRIETNFNERYTDVALAHELEFINEHWQLLQELREAGSVPPG